MSKGLLTLNAGSSSLKFAAFVLKGKGSEPALLLSGQIAGIGFEAQFNARDVNGNKLWDIKKGYLLGPGANIKDSSEFNVDLSNQDLSNLMM